MLLNNFPRSGSTWTQHVFAAAAGYAPETIYHNEGMVRTGHRTSFSTQMRGTPMRGRRGLEPAFVKSHSTHWGCFGGPSKNCHVARVVHFIRNPLDNVFALYHFQNMHATKEKMVAFSKSSQPLTGNMMQEWADFSLKGIELYCRWHCRSLAAYSGLPLLVTHYESILAWVDLAAFPFHHNTFQEIFVMLTIFYSFKRASLDLNVHV